MLRGGCQGGGGMLGQLIACSGCPASAPARSRRCRQPCAAPIPSAVPSPPRPARSHHHNRIPPHTYFLPLCSTPVQVAKSLDEKVSRFLQVMLDACAYAGTGDVLKVQQLLAIA